jgi:uncharacterized lipoprotein YbaY
MILLLFGTGCASLQTNESQSVPQTQYQMISGTIIYPNDLYFPTKIRIEIVLTAINASTGKQTPLVVQTIRNPQKFPVNFTLRYDAKEIVGNHQYVVSVNLYQEGSDRPYLKSRSDYELKLPGFTSTLKVELTAADSI